MHSHYADQNCPSSGYGFRLDNRAYENPNPEVSNLPRTLQECLAGQKLDVLRTNGVLESPNPACSWRQRLRRLFDSALRDAEDMMLSLPYADIREKTDRLATVLDGASSPGSDRAGLRPSTKAKRSRPALPVNHLTPEGGKQARTSEIHSNYCFASSALPVHTRHSSKIMNAMYVPLLLFQLTC
jgi:hypothetical protein